MRTFFFLILLFPVMALSAPSPRALPPNADNYQREFQHVIAGKKSDIMGLVTPKKTQSSAVDDRAHRLMSLQYENVFFEKPALFSLASIQGVANFTLSNFLSDAEFAQTKFSKGADFTWAKFDNGAHFTYSNFYGPASFYSVRFLKHTSFFSAKFEKNANFQFTNFRGFANFSQNLFSEGVNFHKSIFYNDLTFQNTEFGRFADFEYTMFLGMTNFTRAKFSLEANFSHAEFLGRNLFYEVTLPLYLDFSDAEIKNTIDLTTAFPNTKDQKTRLNLLRTDINKIKLRYKMFKLYFPPGTASSDIDFTYQALINALKTNGYEKDYYLAASEFAEYQYLQNHHPILNFIDKYWWNYGFDKPRIFLGILVILFSLTFINALFYDWLMVHAFEVTFLQSLALKDTAQKNWIVRYVHNLPFALLYTVYIFFGGLIGFKRDADKFKSKNYFVNLYLIFIIVVGLMCTFFVLKNL